MGTRIPTFDVVYAELADFLAIVVEGLERGTAHASAYYETRNRKIESALASMLTRSVAKEYLSDKALIAIQEFDRKDIANIGLRMSVGRHDIWIWKSPDNNIPYPGPSLLKRRFLNQGQSHFDSPVFSIIPDIRLAIIWNVDSRYRLTEVYLALPKGAPTTIFGAPDTYWCRPIPYGAETAQPAQPARPDTEGPVRFEPTDEEAAAEGTEEK